MDATATPCQCRICRQPMRQDVQERVNGKSPLVMITCNNPLCELYGYTFTTIGYADKDLGPYLQPRKAQRR